jgi:hypothetical protein
MENWKEIRRDKDGFTTDDCMDEMYAMLPIAVKHKGLYALDLVCKDNWSDAVSDLSGKTYLTHYCTIPELPKEEDDDK